MKLIPSGGWAVRTRITAALILTASLLVPVTGMALAGYQSVLAEIRLLAQVEAAQLRAIGEIGSHLARVRAARRVFFRTGIRDHLAEAQDRLDQAIGLCKRSLRLSDRERVAFGRAGRLLVRYRQALEEAVPLVSELRDTGAEGARLLAGLEEVERLLREAPEMGGEVDSQQQVQAAVTSLLDLQANLEPGSRLERQVEARSQVLGEMAAAAEAELDGIADRSWSALEQRRTLAEDRSQRALRNLITALLLTILLLGALVTWLPSYVIRPLGRLRALVRRVEKEEVDRLDPAAFPQGESRRLAEALVRVLDRQRETRRLQKERIRVLEHRFRALLHGLDEGVLILDGQRRVVLTGGRIRDCLGRSGADLEGRPSDEIFPRGDLDELLDGLLRQEKDRAQTVLEVNGAEGAPASLGATVLVSRDQDRRLEQCLVVLQPPP